MQPPAIGHHMATPNAPLFGLRWVPDSSLRPLRYLPNASAGLGAGPGAGTGAGAGASGCGSSSDRAADWLRGGSSTTAMLTPRAKAGPAMSPSRSRVGASADGAPDTYGDSASGAHKLQMSLRMLTQRLSEAQESVRQKSEQIRWLKEMTKDDASRARVSRWMRGPLLRVFNAWKRCVRDSARMALEDLSAEVETNTARHRELQARCDDLTREHAVLQAALEHFFRDATLARRRASLLASWRRWQPLRHVVVARAPTARRSAAAGRSVAASGGRYVAAGAASGTVLGVRARQAVASRHAIRMLRAHARHSGALLAIEQKMIRRRRVRSLYHAAACLKGLMRCQTKSRAQP